MELPLSRDFLSEVFTGSWDWSLYIVEVPPIIVDIFQNSVIWDEHGEKRKGIANSTAKPVPIVPGSDARLYINIDHIRHFMICCKNHISSCADIRSDPNLAEFICRQGGVYLPGTYRNSTGRCDYAVRLQEQRTQYYIYHVIFEAALVAVVAFLDRTESICCPAMDEFTSRYEATFTTALEKSKKYKNKKQSWGKVFNECHRFYKIVRYITPLYSVAENLIFCCNLVSQLAQCDDPIFADGGVDHIGILSKFRKMIFHDQVKQYLDSFSRQSKQVLLKQGAILLGFEEYQGDIHNHAVNTLPASDTRGDDQQYPHILKTVESSIVESGNEEITAYIQSTSTPIPDNDNSSIIWYASDNGCLEDSLYTLSLIQVDILLSDGDKDQHVSATVMHGNNLVQQESYKNESNATSTMNTCKRKRTDNNSPLSPLYLDWDLIDLGDSLSITMAKNHPDDSFIDNSMNIEQSTLQDVVDDQPAHCAINHINGQENNEYDGEDEDPEILSLLQDIMSDGLLSHNSHILEHHIHHFHHHHHHYHHQQQQNPHTIDYMTWNHSHSV